MNQLPPDDLTARIDRLELHNLFLKVALIVVGLAVVVLCAVVSFERADAGMSKATDKPETKVIEAEQLIIRDVDGRMRMVMLVGQDGPNLLFYDERERVRASLGFEGDYPRLELIGPDGTTTWQTRFANEQEG